MTIDQEADLIANSVLRALRLRDDWDAVAHVVAKKIEMAAWNHQTRHMLKPKQAVARMRNTIVDGILSARDAEYQPPADEPWGTD